MVAACLMPLWRHLSDLLRRLRLHSILADATERRKRRPWLHHCIIFVIKGWNWRRRFGWWVDLFRLLVEANAHALLLSTATKAIL
jgi:hypothetical protein